jgi:hypothetical protein
MVQKFDPKAIIVIVSEKITAKNRANCKKQFKDNALTLTLRSKIHLTILITRNLLILNQK